MVLVDLIGGIAMLTAGIGMLGLRPWAPPARGWLWVLCHRDQPHQYCIHLVGHDRSDGEGRATAGPIRVPRRRDRGHDAAR